MLENPDDLSDWVVVSKVPVVTDVLVSFSSVVTECCADVSLASDWECVELQSFPLSKSVRLCGKRIEER